jgi:hypothetical protein
MTSLVVIWAGIVILLAASCLRLLIRRRRAGRDDDKYTAPYDADADRSRDWYYLP